MPEKLYIQPTDDLPGVMLDANNNIYKIYGRVIPEDGNRFFDPIIDWIAEYVKKPNPETEFYLRLDYYNSSTARMLIKIIVELEKIQKTKNKIKVIWECDDDDDVIKERGEELKSISFLPFELRTL